MIEKTGSAVWQGGLKDGTGRISTQSGVLTDAPYGFAMRFGERPGTNPEELLGAAHAACFSMALSNILGSKGITPQEIDTVSRVSLDPASLTIGKVHLEVVIHADADAAPLIAAAEEAKTGCPVSKLYAGAEITMTARKG